MLKILASGDWEAVAGSEIARSLEARGVRTDTGGEWGHEVRAHACAERKIHQHFQREGAPPKNLGRRKRQFVDRAILTGVKFRLAPTWNHRTVPTYWTVFGLRPVDL